MVSRYTNTNKLSVSSISYQDAVKVSSSCSSSINSCIEEIINGSDIESDIANMKRICRKITNNSFSSSASECVNWCEINGSLEEANFSKLELDKTKMPKYNSILKSFTEILRQYLDNKLLLEKTKALNEKYAETVRLLRKELKAKESSDSPQSRRKYNATAQNSRLKEVPVISLHSRSLENFRNSKGAYSKSLEYDYLEKSKEEINEIFKLLSANSISIAIENIKKLQKVVMSIPVLENFIENICREVFNDYNSRSSTFIEKLIPELKFMKLRLNNLNNFKGTVIKILKPSQFSEGTLV